jgi:hypothetical protein
MIENLKDCYICESSTCPPTSIVGLKILNHTKTLISSKIKSKIDLKE